MRLVCGFVLMALAWVAPVLLGGGGASASMPVMPPASQGPLVHDAKIVCGDFGQGYTCRNEPGAIRRGKMRKIPGASSDEPDNGVADNGGDPDALPPPPGGTSSGGASAPREVPATCPANSELLGGHCIPYTQTCRKGLAAGAPPQVCRAAEEKLVCNFRSDGLKDCCCRTYSKF